MDAAERHEEAFATALIEGTPEALAAWVETGPAAVKRLHAELARERTARLPDHIFGRVIVDNILVVAAAVAAAYPDEFLETFADPGWDESASVRSGLGAIHRPVATLRLMRLLATGGRRARIDAVICLRGHRHRGLQSVLIAALDDPDDLVREEAEARLEELESS